MKQRALTDSEKMLAHAQVMLYNMRSGGPLADADESYRIGSELARRTGDERGLALLLSHFGYSGLFSRAPADGVPAVEEAVEIADRLGDRELGAVVRYTAMLVKLVSGRFPMSTVRRLSEE